MMENELSYKIIGVAIDLHKNIGPGLLESVYENAFAHDLKEAGFLYRVRCQCLSSIKKLKWMWGTE